jgi:hypothetical protein
MEDRELTRGEQMVGLSFNPSGNADVNKIKVLYAEIIDLMWTMRGRTVDSDTMADVAIQSAITAQMWAVKAITYNH